MKAYHNTFVTLFTFLLCSIATHSTAQKVPKDKCVELLDIAETNTTQGRYDSAFILLNNAIECFKEASNKRGQAEALTKLGALYEYRTDYVTSFQYYLEAMRIYEELGEKDQEAFIKRLIALYYQRNKEFGKAKDIFVKLIEAYKKKEDNIEEAGLYSDLGLLYLESTKFDSAIYFLDKAYLLNEKLNNRYVSGIVTNNLGDCYKFMGLYDQAISYYLKSLAICEEIKDIEGTVWPMHSLASIYTEQGNFEDAEKLLQKSRTIAEGLKIPFLRKDNYLHASRLDSARQNFKMAYYWHKLYTTVDDSLSSVQNSVRIHEMNVRFESDQKDREIQFLNKEKQSYIVLLSISGLFIVLLLYLVIYRIQMQRRLNKQKLEVLKANKELNVVNEYLEDVIQEKEGLIGIVAHDLRSPFTKTTGLLNLIKLTGPVNTEQEGMITMIEKVCNDGNVLIQDLLEISQSENNAHSHAVTNQIQVNDYLKNLVLHHQQRAAEKKIQIEIDSQLPESTTLDTSEELLTRILDNLISNAVKFSNPETNVLITVHAADEHVFFSVKDEGPGIKEEEKVHLFKKFKKLSARPTAGETSTGLGLSIVKALVEQLGGSISVESAMGMGTTFTVGIPSLNNSAQINS